MRTHPLRHSTLAPRSRFPNSACTGRSAELAAMKTRNAHGTRPPADKFVHCALQPFRRGWRGPMKCRRVARLHRAGASGTSSGSTSVTPRFRVPSNSVSSKPWHTKASTVGTIQDASWRLLLWLVTTGPVEAEPLGRGEGLVDAGSGAGQVPHRAALRLPG